jgi:hypothetical protein
VILEYQLELAVAGMHDVEGQDLAVADRLAQLKTVQDGWSNLRFRQRRQIPFNPERVWEMFGGVLAQGIPGPTVCGLAFTELPSAVNRASGHTWKHRDLGVDIRDFAMDPAQDLLVLIDPPVTVSCVNCFSQLVPLPYVPCRGSADTTKEILVHLRTMSGGETHLLALQPVLSFIPNPCHENYGFVIQIMEDFLGIHFYDSESFWLGQLFIWDWKSGELVTVRLQPPCLMLMPILDLSQYLTPVVEGISSFSFLSPRHFVVSRYGSSEIPSPQLEVYDFLAHRSEGSTIPQLKRTYELPCLDANFYVYNIITQSGPSPSFSQRFASCGRPFYTAPNSRLLVVSLDYRHLMRPLSSFALFVHHSSLLKGLESESGLAEVVPWENWGPTETRLIPTEYNEPPFVNNVHGTRYVRLESLDFTQASIPSCHLQMLDFNILAPKRGEFGSTVSRQGVSFSSMNSSIQECIGGRDNGVAITRFDAGRQHCCSCI